jgi:hypothetical protein
MEDDLDSSVLRDGVGELLDETGFADPRFPTEQSDVAGAVSDVVPAAPQQGEFFLPTDQGGESGLDGDVKTALDPTFPEDLVHCHGQGQTFGLVEPQTAMGKQPGNEALGGRADHHGIGLGQGLQPGSQIRGFAEGEVRASSRAT